MRPSARGLKPVREARTYRRANERRVVEDEGVGKLGEEALSALTD
jgi:hypothetical protein